ncbi:DUF2249 domain-containing protein [Oscillatoria laete-virens NRMC-F 0139]|nr:DUF2249 domain-containing protein [Oscillatoria laete-virens NRMC-F 0139]
MTDNSLHTLDVREMLKNRQEPFSLIMGTIRALGDNQTLLLITPFEPTPLFGVLAKMGFQHESRQIGDDHWENTFYRTSPPGQQFDPSHQRPTPDDAVLPMENQTIDVRGLEPPLPMVRILETLHPLPAGKTLTARLDRCPMHLIARLDQEGHRHQETEQKDGSWLVTITQGGVS